MVDGKARGLWREVWTTVAVFIALCGLGAALSSFLSFASAIPIFLCALTLLAWRMSRWVSVLACLFATLTLDFFFTQPRYTLRVGSGQDVAALLSFLITVLFISVLSGRLSKQKREVEEREDAQRALRQLAERSIQLDWRESVPDELCRSVRSVFELRSVCIWDAVDQRFAASGDTAQNCEGLRAVFMAERDFDIRKSGMSIRVLRSGVKPVGSLQLEGNLPDAATMGALVSLVSLTLERTHALENEVTAQSESLSEQLRSSVLDGLAHSIKTPLTTILVSAAGVSAIGGLTDVQASLLGGVQEQTERIAALTDRLLRMARLDPRMVVKRKQVDLAELLQGSIRGLEDSERFRLETNQNSSIAYADPDLLQMAFAQIAENALKYSPPGTPITVALTSERADAKIAVHNQDSFIPPLEIPLVFKRFYRAQGSEHRAPGTGLGLSVARRAVEALGGKISLTSGQEAGTTFTIEIPL